MKHLLLDFGSTSVKFALFDTNRSEPIEKDSFPFPKRKKTNSPLLCEIELSKIKEILYSVIEKYGKTADAVHLSVQMHGYLLADKDMIPLTDYISWQDKRSLLQYGISNYYSLFQSTYPGSPELDSGTKIKPNSPLCGIFALSKENPSLLDHTSAFFTLGSYLAYLLTGINTTHITDAAATGFYCATTSKKSNSFPFPFQIPTAVSNYTPIGTYQNLAVYPPVGDHQASFLGARVSGHSEYLLNLGTAAQLSTLTFEKIYGEYEKRPYFDGSSLCTVSGLIGGKEIYENKAEQAILENELYENYHNAIKKLPTRSAVVLAGGTVTHYEPLISAVCDRLNLPYKKAAEKDALHGLIRLIKGE